MIACSLHPLKLSAQRAKPTDNARRPPPSRGVNDHGRSHRSSAGRESGQRQGAVSLGRPIMIA